MHTYLKWTLVLICLLGLTSCATVNKQPPAQNTTTSWENRATILSNIKTWDLKGLIAIRTSHDAWSANWQWQQQQKNYTISLFGPLGTHSVQLAGSAQSVELTTENGKKFTAKDPETLLEKQLGWHLPVSHLLYWIRGLPVPGIPAQKQFDNYHHLTHLTQQDWNVEYLRYTSVNHVDLPGKMTLTNPTLNVKIIINQWQL